jgi:hypothetical protein
VRGDHHFHALAGKRTARRQSLIQNTGQRVDVGCGRHGFVEESLGRHEGEGADVGARHSQPGFTLRLGDAEIDQVCEIGRCDDDVLRFHVAMDQPLVVRRV